jgi:hypothetical protein
MSKINCTKNYRLFERSQDNRALCPEKHKRLLASMKLYGFLEEFPIVCFRDKDKHLVIKDGQHRFAIAETLGLAVYWIEATKDWKVDLVNSTVCTWALRDYAEKFAAQGIKAYQEGIDFSDANHMPIGTAFALLAGTASWGNVRQDFISGVYRVKDRNWAELVASIYVPFTKANKALRNARFIEACMAAGRVEGFDAERLIHGMERCRDKLAAFSTRDAYLDMLEIIYNFGRKTLFALKNEAVMAMRNRNSVKNAA